MKKNISICAVFFLVLVSFGSTASTSVGDGPFTTDLIASQHYDVGDMTVWNDADYLYVTYKLDIVWLRFLQTHLHVAMDVNDIPQANGNPIPGQFDHSVFHRRWVQEYTYQIRMNSKWVPGTELCIAAHSVITGICGLTATGWGDGFTYPGVDQSWATYFVYTVE